MIIMGVDPGFAITGYGILEYQNNKLKLLEVGAVETKARELFTWRLLQIDEKLTELLRKHEPDAFAIEELFFNNSQNGHCGRTGTRRCRHGGGKMRDPCLRIYAAPGQAGRNGATAAQTKTRCSRW